ncbi:MAG: hypothetical protein NTW62_02055 [Candidatus Nomurabacteria bacterium]|nr:hypothetical protein [Candidatus Nomurabacteria bacterium]
MQNQSQKNLGLFIGVGVVFLVLLSTFMFGKKNDVPTNSNGDKVSTPVSRNNSTDTISFKPITTTPPPISNPAPVTKPVVLTPPPPVVTTKQSVYKDGSYSATGSYNSPGGYDELGVSLVLKNDTITDINVTNMAGDGTSSRYQDRFISGYKQYVVGQKIDDIYLSRVSGASLTPIGFNDALDQIKSKAKA